MKLTYPNHGGVRRALERKHKNEFPAINQQGADKYGVQWLKATEVIADAARGAGLDISTPAAKFLLARICFMVCWMLSEQHDHLKSIWHDRKPDEP